jgi:hypothetical protein
LLYQYNKWIISINPWMLSFVKLSFTSKLVFFDHTQPLLILTDFNLFAHFICRFRIWTNRFYKRRLFVHLESPFYARIECYILFLLKEDPNCFEWVWWPPSLSACFINIQWTNKMNSERDLPLTVFKPHVQIYAIVEQSSDEYQLLGHGFLSMVRD